MACVCCVVECAPVSPRRAIRTVRGAAECRVLMLHVRGTPYKRIARDEMAHCGFYVQVAKLLLDEDPGAELERLAPLHAAYAGMAARVHAFLHGFCAVGAPALCDLAALRARYAAAQEAARALPREAVSEP